ncbi:MAG TPA: shikimate dehydrogenase [Gammaproteobacteria bacterium]
MTAAGAVARYAVVGNPISHSLSPRIHARFAEQTGQALSYQAIELDVDGFRSGVQDLQQQGYAGLNVTVPFKRDAWEICDRRSRLAEDAGAVNTLSLRPDGGISGDNTDGTGLVRDLETNLQCVLAGKRILLLGAGGAARGVIGPLLDLTPRSLVIANRTPARAVELVGIFTGRGEMHAAGFDELGDAHFELVINATAAGLTGELPPLPASCIDTGTICYDMMYDLAAPTAFVAWARSRGAALACDGLGMLVEQAAEAFFIWRGVRPNSADVIAMLRPH